MPAVNQSPKYELTLYKPKAEDPTETAVLTQLEDAGETFVVTTDRADDHPYLETPVGLSGQIKMPSRRVEIGTGTLRILDKRVSTGNLDRWVTRFMGNTEGQNRLKGVKVRLREWDSVAASWTTLFTRRVVNTRLSSKLWFELEVKDLVEELDTEVFTGPPHGSLSYVGRGSLLPAGLVNPWAGLITVRPLRGTVAASATQIVVDRTDVDEGRDVLIQQLHDVLWDPAVTEQQGFLSFTPEYITVARVHVKILESTAAPGRVGEEGDFWLAKTIPLPSSWPLTSARVAAGYQIDEKKRYRVTGIGFMELRAEDPDYLAAPADDDVVEFNVFGYGPATERDPILIGPVHPAELEEDLLAGKFGPLVEAPADGTVGDPLISFGADAAAFTTLKADASFGSIYMVIYGPEGLRKFIENSINLPHGLGYRIDELARYAPFDWRLSSDDVAGLLTIGDDDVVLDDEGALDFEDRTDGAVTRVKVTYYTDVQQVPWGRYRLPEGIPDVPAVRFVTLAHTRHHILARFGQLSDNPLEIDALGIRDIVAGVQDDSSDRVKGQVARIVGQFRSPFGNGPRIIRLKCRRTTNVLSCVEGSLRKLTHSAIPDPATNRRGGSRLGRCIQRTPQGAHILLRFLDLGSETVANVPAIGAVVKNATDGQHAVDAPITVNAQSEPAVVEYAVTATSVAVRPDEDDEAWTHSGRVTATGTIVVRPVPAGKRIWIRSRTETGEEADPKIPSGWAFPAASYVDVDGLPAPTNLSLTAVGRTIVATCTPGAADLALMPVIAVNPGPAVNALTAPLVPASERHVFTEIAASTTYLAGFKHVDGRGGESALLTSTKATGVADQLDPPRRVQIRSGRTSLSRELAASGEASIGYGLWVGFQPAEMLARHRLQVSTDSGFATLEDELMLEPGVALYPVQVKRDAVDDVRYIRFRAERDEFTDSVWSSIVGGLPTELLAEPGPDAFPGGYAELRVNPDGEVEAHVGRGGDESTDRAYLVVEKNPDPVAYPAVDDADDFITSAQMPYDGVVDDGVGGDLTAAAGDLLMGRVRFWNKATGFGQEVLLKRRVDASELVDCRPVLDEDAGGKFNLHPYRTAVAKSVKWLVKTDGSTPTDTEVRTTGAVATAEDFLAHTSTLDGENVIAGVLAYENDDATGAEGPLRIARARYSSANSRPVVTWIPFVPTDSTKEGVRFTARDDGAQVNFGYAVIDFDAADPAVWPDDYAVTGLVADPQTVDVAVTKPAEGAKNKAIVFNTVDAAGNFAYDKPQRVEVDGDAIPRGTMTGRADGSGDTEVDVNSQDSDGGSWRFALSKTAYTEPSGDAAEFGGAGFPAHVTLGATWKLSPSEKLYVRGYLYRTTSPIWANQNASTKSLVIEFVIEANGTTGGDVGNFGEFRKARWIMVTSGTMGIMADVYVGPATDKVRLDYTDPATPFNLQTGNVQSVTPGTNELQVLTSGGAAVAYDLSSQDISVLLVPIDTDPDPDDEGLGDAVHFNAVGDTAEGSVRTTAQDGSTEFLQKSLAAENGKGFEFTANGGKVLPSDFIVESASDPGERPAGYLWFQP